MCNFVSFILHFDLNSIQNHYSQFTYYVEHLRSNCLLDMDVNLDFFSFQSFKRLKKHQPHEWCSTTDDPSRNSGSNSTESKEVPTGGSRDKSSRGTGIPISIKFKKTANDGEPVHREQRHQHELGRTMREPPPLEIGPKRLKVRGPSVN